GSGCNGTAGHLSGELLKMMARVNMVHVPYRGEAPALTDLLGGQVQVMFGTVPASIEYIRAGKLRALAVTSARRSEVLPDLSTVGEFVPGYETSALSRSGTGGTAGPSGRGLWSFPPSRPRRAPRGGGAAQKKKTPPPAANPSASP